MNTDAKTYYGQDEDRSFEGEPNNGSGVYAGETDCRQRFNDVFRNWMSYLGGGGGGGLVSHGEIRS